MDSVVLRLYEHFFVVVFLCDYLNKTLPTDKDRYLKKNKKCTKVLQSCSCTNDNLVSYLYF